MKILDNSLSHHMEISMKIYVKEFYKTLFLCYNQNGDNMKKLLATFSYLDNFYELYADKDGILKKLDILSNKYLGTKGESYGSWNNEKQIYEGGIFSGCKTSSNYEIWDRVLRIDEAFYKEQYNTDFSPLIKPLPGINVHVLPILL